MKNNQSDTIELGVVPLKRKATLDPLFVLPKTSPFYLAWKRSFDFIAAFLLLILFAPLMAAVALLIMLDSRGSPLFTQQRKGLNQKPFKMLKFRTMINNAALMRRSLEPLSEADGILFKIKDDPRITRLGRFLRYYSIDELPQLINVLKGEMSLIGPRPLPFEDFQRLGDVHRLFRHWVTARHSVRPGVSGLWQVSGRSSLPFAEMIKLDLMYIENRSLFLDLRILIRTASVVVSKNGAY